MTTATSQDRLRQIAILVSSVDADASRQLLLHLPTEKARQVRAMAAQLGSIAPDERRQILAEFQRSATSAPPNSNASTSREMPPRETMEPPSSSRHPDSGGASWTRLSSSALARFVRSERPAVSAVVISRLAPGTAVDVLQQLTTEAAHDILRRLSDLQEIDPEAMEAIDEHLSQRLGEYQHHMESELENSRRIHALLEAAPAELRQQWSQILSSSAQPGQSNQPSEPLPPPAESRQEPTAELDVFDLGGTTLFATADAEPNELKREEPVEILSLSQAAAKRSSSVVDSAAIQLEFQHILQLPQHLLAQLLSETDSESVLLALAGATPEFMKRFYNMLDRNGARALQSRLQRIGAIQLRDIDKAQRRIVQRAAALASSQAPLSGMGGMQRAA